MYELETNLITRYINRPTALETITLADYAAFFDSSRTTQKQPTAEGLSGSNTEEETTHNPRSASPSAPKKNGGQPVYFDQLGSMLIKTQKSMPENS